MHCLRHLSTLALASTLITAAPLESAAITPGDDVPQCGYVKIRQGDGFIVGVYTTNECEPIYGDEAATIFRVERPGCGCRFFE